MTTDLLLRPARATVLRQHQTVIAATPAAVFAALSAAVDPGPESGFATDEPTGLIVVQGGWWYRAEYRVGPDEAGTRVGVTIVNVATPAHWAGPIAGRAEIRSSARHFGDVVDRVRGSL